MIDCDDCVSLSDDDNVVEVSSKDENSKLHKHFNSMETIILDEDVEQNINEIQNNNVIEVPDSQGDDDSFVKTIQKIHCENKLFVSFIDKCLDLENSDGMIRIIEKTVLKAYEDCDRTYIASPKFHRVLSKAITRLYTDPDHKFSHVKNLVDTLKSNKKKKRVQLTTLATNLKDNTSQPDRCFSNNLKPNNFISLDSDEEQKDDDVICLDEDGDLEAEKENQETQKTYTLLENVVANSQENFLVPQVEMPYSSSQESSIGQEIPVEYDPPNPIPGVNMTRVKELEKAIAFWKEKIQVLEEAEVVDDNATSPYVLCESYKAQVVVLYKELCSIIGEKPIKQRKVRLKVLQGHPPGPVKRLELFINNNIGEDGSPLFPDFCDVVKCVMIANIEDNLGWNKHQVMDEANALFTQCGRALQKKRQKREYRDLIARVKVEAPDPADFDPELRRRLEENRRTALKKELDLIERYAQLQDQGKAPSALNTGSNQNQAPNQNVNQDTSKEYPHVSNHGNQTLTNGSAESAADPQLCVRVIHVETNRVLNINQNVNNDNDKAEPSPLSEQQDTSIQCLVSNQHCVQMIHVETNRVPDNNQNVHDNNEQPQPSPLSEHLSDEDSDFEPPEIPLSQEIAENGEENKTEDKTDEESKVKVKQEPMDIAQLLEDLGSDYTTSVDIFDPFLVIEISSDSSDDEMVVDGESD